MRGKKLITVWIGLLFLSGMFLMGCPPPCIDEDGDGYGIGTTTSCEHPELDCDDTNANVNPGVIEGPDGRPKCNDGIDNDCDGRVDSLDDSCLDMVQISAGCFDMGDSIYSCNAPAKPDECPVHNVCISAFEMNTHEVTNAEYADCVSAGECTLPWSTDSHARPTYYGDPAYDDFPVIHVDWYQASQYCAWAGNRLPTEAEWEYAARGGLDGKRFPWGDEIDHSYANYWDLDGFQDTTSVQCYPPNGFGLYDVAGNVWEWVNDWWGEDYYDDSPPNDPPGPISGTFRVVRGGCWLSSWYDLRVAYRGGFLILPDYETFAIGFRCAR